MAGHSKFANIKHRKAAQDSKRAKVFGKHIREITTATRMGGPDPDANPRLRSALLAARGVNMPKDVIERAIKKGSGDTEGENYEEIRYEGYGPGGVAVIVEALTDNRNRTAAEVRSCFSKYGGNLGETGSVSFGFDQVGEIIYSAEVASAEAMFEAALEAGAQDVDSGSEIHEIITAMEDLVSVASALEAKFGEPKSANLSWRAQNDCPVDEKTAETLLKLIDALEDSDDVQDVYSNMDVDDEVLERLSNG